MAGSLGYVRARVAAVLNVNDIRSTNNAPSVFQGSLDLLFVRHCVCLAHRDPLVLYIQTSTPGQIVHCIHVTHAYLISEGGAVPN